MKKLIKKTALFLFVLCTVVFNTSAQKAEYIDTVFLISTYLDLRLPVVPVVDAAVLNNKIKPISNEITLMFKDVIDSMRITVAEVMHNELKFNVVYGADLQKRNGFNELKAKYGSNFFLQTGDDYFPEIIAANDDLNPFRFEKGKIEKYFKNQDNYGNTISEICKSLKINYFAVSQTYLFPMPGSLTKSRTLFLVNYFYLFNSDGKCLGNTFGQIDLPKGIEYQPEDVNSYREVINLLPDALVEALKKFAKKNSKNISNDYYKNFNL